MRLDKGGFFWIFAVGEVFDKIKGESSCEEDGEHFDLEGLRGFGSRGDFVARCGPEFCGPVDGGGTHEVADGIDSFLFRLQSLSKLVDDVREESSGSIGT
jgi:hypothetical protein